MTDEPGSEDAGPDPGPVTDGTRRRRRLLTAAGAVVVVVAAATTAFLVFHDDGSAPVSSAPDPTAGATTTSSAGATQAPTTSVPGVTGAPGEPTTTSTPGAAFAPAGFPAGVPLPEVRPTVSQATPRSDGTVEYALVYGTDDFETDADDYREVLAGAGFTVSADTSLSGLRTFTARSSTWEVSVVASEADGEGAIVVTVVPIAAAGPELGEP